MFSAFACQQYLLCIWKTKKNPGATSKEPDKGLDLHLHWQGCKKSWLTPQSCRISSLAASEHNTPLQKPERQQVSVSVTAEVLRIKGISFSLRVTQFHEYFPIAFVYNEKALCLWNWLLKLPSYHELHFILGKRTPVWITCNYSLSKRSQETTSLFQPIAIDFDYWNEGCCREAGGKRVTAYTSSKLSSGH